MAIDFASYSPYPREVSESPKVCRVKESNFHSLAKRPKSAPSSHSMRPLTSKSNKPHSDLVQPSRCCVMFGGAVHPIQGGFYIQHKEGVIAHC